MYHGSGVFLCTMDRMCFKVCLLLRAGEIRKGAEKGWVSEMNSCGTAGEEQDWNWCSSSPSVFNLSNIGTGSTKPREGNAAEDSC